jgi:hypothetical protein
MSFYWSIFGLCCVAAAVLLVVQRGGGVTEGAGNVEAFKWHMAVYVAIYSLMMCELQADVCDAWHFREGLGSDVVNQ